MTKRKINKAKLFRRTILVILVLGIVGFYFSNRFVKNYGFDGIGDFVSNYFKNKSLADKVTPEVLQINISESDYKFLEDKRQEALDRGIQINVGNNYVNCELEYQGELYEGEMRLKGHMTDHLEGDKWSFRVKTKKEVMGMYRFSLQNPATRNYAYEWVYHKLLEEEGVIHLYYDFINLKLNEKDLGIYAVEEHFGQHVLDRNNKPKGAILRWNPELYWEWRIDELHGTYLDEQYSDYSSSFVEPYDGGVVEKDSSLIETYIKGASQLEAFRRGEKSASEVFDIAKMASFHAVIDLVGGHHSLDWSDVKFYYNSETGLVEPIGYESFSVRKTEKIAGQRTPDVYEGPGLNYHDQLFKDPIFFAAYIQTLERICDEEYFGNFIASIQEELDLKLGVLAHEWPYLKFSFSPYFENIELIKHNIELPKPFHAFLEGSTDSTIMISLSPVSDFPIEIISLVRDGKKEYELDSTFVLPSKARNTYAHYFQLIFKVGKSPKNLTVKAKIPGSSNVFEVKVEDLPSYRTPYKEVSLDTEALEEKMELYRAIHYLPLDSFKNYLKNDVVILEKPVYIAENEKLIIPAGKHVNFIMDGKIINNGILKILGGDDENEVVFSSKIEGYTIDNFGGKVVCRNLIVNGTTTPFMRTEGGEVFVQSSQFVDVSGYVFVGDKAEITLRNLACAGLQSIGLFEDCMVKMKDVYAVNGESFISGFGSDIEMVTCEIKSFKQLAIIDHNSDLRAWSSSFSDLETIAELNNASFLQTFVCTFENCDLGFVVDNSTRLPGESSYVLYRTSSEGIKELEKNKS